MLKTFTVAPKQDSVRTAFNHGQRATSVRLSLEKSMDLYPEYVLKQDDVPVAILRGKEMVCGGEHFAVIPILSPNWDAQGAYRPSPDNAPYWGCEQRLRSLDVLLYNLSQGWVITAALDDAVDADDDELFAGLPEVAYTGQPIRACANHGQPGDFPLQATPGEWEPEPGPEPEPEQTPPTSMTPDAWSALAQRPEQTPPAKIYPWTFWYRGRDGDAHQVILEATYEDAQRVWDKLITTLDMTSKRP